MFVQIVQGHLKDAETFTRQSAKWPVELKAGAAGYAGSTWGITADGVGVICARFDSEETMRANDDRPEQDAWWKIMETAFDDVSFRDCSEVDIIMGGGSNDAGFVQVIQGRATDRDAARAMFRGDEGDLAKLRPEILGGVIAWNGDDGDFTQVMYFATEEQARSGEEKLADSEVSRQYHEMMATPPSFFNLTSPIFD